MARSVKKALVIRYGGIGDMIIVTPVLRRLAEEGYEIHVETKQAGFDVLRNNIYVSKLIKHDLDLKEDEEFTEHWDKIGKGYDKVLNLSGSIEGTLAISSYDPKSKTMTKEERHAQCNKNFYDHTMKVAGYPEAIGEVGELFFTAGERRWAQDQKGKHKGNFVVLWGLTGSSLHKAYPWAEYVAMRLLEEHEDMTIITVGEELAQLLEWEHPRAVKKAGVWTLRKSLAMAEWADLVVAPDTGLIHAAATTNTPMVLLLSGNTEENVSKHWKNCKAVHGDAPCYPCHVLQYYMGTCELDKTTGTPSCMAKLKPEVVYGAIKDTYEEWKGRKTNGHDVRRRSCNIH